MMIAVNLEFVAHNPHKTRAYKNISLQKGNREIGDCVASDVTNTGSDLF